MMLVLQFIHPSFPVYSLSRSCPESLREPEDKVTMSSSQLSVSFPFVTVIVRCGMKRNTCPIF